jgi:hypothetical protein
MEYLQSRLRGQDANHTRTRGDHERSPAILGSMLAAHSALAAAVWLDLVSPDRDNQPQIVQKGLPVHSGLEEADLPADETPFA